MNNFILNSIDNQKMLYQIEIVKKLIKKHKKRKDRIISIQRQGFNVVQGGYMRNSSKIGEIEYFPKKSEYRLTISRPSNHLCRQFDYVIFHNL